MAVYLQVLARLHVGATWRRHTKDCHNFIDLVGQQIAVHLRCASEECWLLVVDNWPSKLFNQLQNSVKFDAFIRIVEVIAELCACFRILRIHLQPWYWLDRTRLFSLLYFGCITVWFHNLTDRCELYYKD